jgi:hypothetical protein
MWTIARLADALSIEREKGDLTELYEEADGTHDEETYTNGLGDLDKLLSVSCSQIYISTLAH